MLNKFNTTFFNILCEENINNIEAISNDKNTIEDPKYIDKTLAMVPGSFKPPHKGHWNMILEYTKIADYVYIFISNISTKVISNRSLSKSNLQPIAKLISKFEDKKNNYVDKTLYQFISNQFENLIRDSNLNMLNYNVLIKYIETIINKINETKSTEFSEFVENLNKIKIDLDKKLFKSIRNTENNIEIEPETSKEIFEIFINRYGLTDKVFVEIPENPSPMAAVIPFVNDLCKDCTIYLGSSKKGGDEARWDSFLKSFEKNPTNYIIEYPVEVKTNLSATDLRNNITSLKREWFPEKITDADFNKIQELLTNE